MGSTLLAEELAGLRDDTFDLDLLGFDAGELEQLLAAAEGDTSEAEDEFPEPPVEPISKPGDLWLLGDHRVLCSDATVLADVERVLDGSLADMAWTDPPYNVDYGNSAKDKLRGKDRPILYGWPAGAERYWCGARDQGDVWHFDKPVKTTCTRR